MPSQPPAAAAGTITFGGGLTVRRLGFGAMRITGPEMWGTPPDPDQAIATLRRAVDLGVNFIDAADAYGPAVSENLIAQALHPYPDDLVIATKGGLTRPGPYEWKRDRRPEHLRRAALTWLLAISAAMLPIPGTGSPAHVEDNVRATAVKRQLRMGPRRVHRCRPRGMDQAHRSPTTRRTSATTCCTCPPASPPTPGSGP